MLVCCVVERSSRNASPFTSYAEQSVTLFRLGAFGDQRKQVDDSKTGRAERMPVAASMRMHSRLSIFVSVLDFAANKVMVRRSTEEDQKD